MVDDSYLIFTAKGLITQPALELLKIAGIFEHEATDDLVCAKIRTGFVILVANCLIMCYFELQYALFTMYT